MPCTTTSPGPERIPRCAASRPRLVTNTSRIWPLTMLATAESEHGMTTLRGAIRFTQTLVQTGVLCAVLAASASALAFEEGAGKKKAEQVCAGCHGPAGNKPVMAETPRLAGQHY